VQRWCNDGAGGLNGTTMQEERPNGTTMMVGRRRRRCGGAGNLLDGAATVQAAQRAGT